MSEELFEVRNQFYSADYSSVLQHDFKSSSPDLQPYILRSLVSTQQYSKAIDLVQESETKLLAIKFYSQYKTGASIKDQFLSHIKQNTEDLLTKIYGTAYLVEEFQNYEESLELLSTGLDLSAPSDDDDDVRLEIYSMMIQLQLLNNQIGEAKTLLKKFSKLNINDSIVFNYADSLVSLITNGEEAVQHSYYFFEEVAYQHKTLKNFGYLMMVHLMLGHFPEALQLIDELDADQELANDDEILNYLIVKSKVLLLNGKSEDYQKIIDEILIKFDKKNHPFIQDYNEKSKLFDSIVDNYAEQINV